VRARPLPSYQLSISLTGYQVGVATAVATRGQIVVVVSVLVR
jgi:hypothetical protein